MNIATIESISPRGEITADYGSCVKRPIITQTRIAVDPNITLTLVKLSISYH